MSLIRRRGWLLAALASFSCNGPWAGTDALAEDWVSMSLVRTTVGVGPERVTTLTPSYVVGDTRNRDCPVFAHLAVTLEDRALSVHRRNQSTSPHCTSAEGEPSPGVPAQGDFCACPAAAVGWDDWVGAGSEEDGLSLSVVADGSSVTTRFDRVNHAGHIALPGARIGPGGVALLHTGEDLTVSFADYPEFTGRWQVDWYVVPATVENHQENAGGPFIVPLARQGLAPGTMVRVRASASSVDASAVVTSGRWGRAQTVEGLSAEYFDVLID